MRGVSRREFMKDAVIASALVLSPGLARGKNHEQEGLKRLAYFCAKILPALEPRIRQYSEGLGALLENIYEPGNKVEVPGFVHERVDSIFSGVLSPVNDWNRRLFEEGRMAHYAAYVLQDFRNSPVAGALSMAYGQFNDYGEMFLEERLSEIVPDARTYDLLFRLGMRPLVFDPREVPENKVIFDRPDWNHGLPYYVVLDPRGKHIFSGVDESPALFCEGNSSHLRDAQGRLEGFVLYFSNVQPNFMFISPESMKRGIDGDFFKTYLGAKGMMLWYKQGNFSFVSNIPLTKPQVAELRQFFRWERHPQKPC